MNKTAAVSVVRAGGLAPCLGHHHVTMMAMIWVGRLHVALLRTEPHSQPRAASCWLLSWLAALQCRSPEGGPANKSFGADWAHTGLSHYNVTCTCVSSGLKSQNCMVPTPRCTTTAETFPVLYMVLACLHCCCCCTEVLQQSCKNCRAGVHRLPLAKRKLRPEAPGSASPCRQQQPRPSYKPPQVHTHASSSCITDERGRAGHRACVPCSRHAQRATLAHQAARRSS